MSRSDYYSTLPADVKCRYDKKVELIENIDPYCLRNNELTNDLNAIPKVSIVDLMNYLVLTHSFYTGQQIKAQKSLTAYKFYEAGFVLEVLSKKINVNTTVVISKVRHSQKAREQPNRVWIIILNDGSISSAHCMCMAGLGEVCSHVAAVLFLLEARVATIQEETSCTSVLAQWPVPSTSRGVEMKRICEMDWSRKINVGVCPKPNVVCMEGDERITFIRELQNIGVDPALSRILEPFASEMIPVSLQLPKGLEELLYREDLIGTPYSQLIEYKIEISLALEEIEAIEAATRGQSASDLWHRYRGGRITASKAKMVSNGNIRKPSLSLIKGICYPQKVVFFSKATNYGIKNEKKALESYYDPIKNLHKNVKIKTTGFIISPDHPELGASPDSVVECECCGSGCVEVKCPYTLRDLTLQEFSSKKNSFLLRESDRYILSHNHVHYFQVQFQMFITKYKYCDFVMWSKDVMNIERIVFDEIFCQEVVQKCLLFHKLVVKPELLAKFFTTKGSTDHIDTWCVCHKGDDGRPMLKCDNIECTIEWFHFECIGLIELPEIWYCTNCK